MPFLFFSMGIMWVQLWSYSPEKIWTEGQHCSLKEEQIGSSSRWRQPVPLRPLKKPLLSQSEFHQLNKGSCIGPLACDFLFSFDLVRELRGSSEGWRNLLEQYQTVSHYFSSSLVWVFPLVLGRQCSRNLLHSLHLLHPSIPNRILDHILLWITYLCELCTTGKK